MAEALHNVTKDDGAIVLEFPRHLGDRSGVIELQPNHQRNMTLFTDGNPDPAGIQKLAPSLVTAEHAAALDGVEKVTLKTEWGKTPEIQSAMPLIRGFRDAVFMALSDNASALKSAERLWGALISILDAHENNSSTQHKIGGETWHSTYADSDHRNLDLSLNDLCAEVQVVAGGLRSEGRDDLAVKLDNLAKITREKLSQPRQS